MFLDVGMEAVLNPINDAEVRAGAGCKVVVTLGPACHDVATLSRLLLAGVTCARINLSWGTKAYFEHCLANLGEAMKQTRRLCRCDAGREVHTCGCSVAVDSAALGCARALGAGVGESSWHAWLCALWALVPPPSRPAQPLADCQQPAAPPPVAAPPGPLQRVSRHSRSRGDHPPARGA